MKHYTSIPSFYKAVNVPQPKFDHFDTQTLEEHNQNVIRKFGPVKHELYSVAIMEKVSGNINVGNHSVKSSKQYVIFIYSPYQLLSWDVGDEMKGFYILFTDDFIRNSIGGAIFY